MYLPLVCILAGVWLGMAAKVVVVAWKAAGVEIEAERMKR